MLDAQTALELTGFLVSAVGVFKFAIKGGPNQNNYVRLMSALGGAAVFVLYGLTHGHDTTAAAYLQDAVDLAGQGFTAGAGGSVAVKAYHLAGDALSNVSLKGKPAAPTA